MPLTILLPFARLCVVGVRVALKLDIFRVMLILGADPGFSFRGAQKIMRAHAHHERET